MKRISSLFLILLSFSSCEKDDICDATTATTPGIVIEFYNTATTPVVKNVTNLKVVGEGIANYYLFNNVSKIKLPLKTSADVTKFSFIINSTDSATQNEDLIEFNYTRKNVFISRACGFKTLYYLNATNPLLLTDSVVNDGNWIQNFTIETSNIETENETHIKIYY
jgi:hypothetical protein